MARRPSVAIADMLDRIDFLSELMTDLSLARLREDRVTRYAIERALEIISEASRSIPASEKEALPNTDWRGLADIGNILRHQYQDIVNSTIWDILTFEIDPLKQVLLRLAEKYPPPKQSG
jgi:uncharacterized protein with HEPN domain